MSVTCALLTVLLLVSVEQEVLADEAFKPPPDAKVNADVVYATVGDTQLHMDIVLPKEPKSKRPCVVWIHGGGWREGSYKANRAAWMAGHGYVVASIQYRFSQEAIFPAQIHDCKAAIRFLRKNAFRYGIDPSRIGAWGLSAGGHLSALLATSGGVKELEGSEGDAECSSRIQAVCDFYGPADFSYMPQTIGNKPSPVTALLGGSARTKRELARLASPITHITKDDPPVLIAHGDQDTLVNIRQSERFLDALTKAGVEAKLIVVKGAGHGFPESGAEPTREEIDKQVLAFFDRHLKR